MAILLLAYISDAARVYSEQEMEDLLRVCRKNNKELNVSGMLLYAENKFLQILEGNPEVVHALYEKIEQDSRHHNVTIMDTDLIEERSFDEWSMGFHKTNSEGLDQISEGYVEMFDGEQLAIKNCCNKNICVHILLSTFKRIIETKPEAA